MAKLDRLLRELISKGGSDLHLSSERVPMLRVDGEMEMSSWEALAPEEVEALLLEIMEERVRLEYDEKADTDFAYEIEGLARFRANVFQDRYGMGGVFRQIPSSVLTADQLNLPKSIRDLCWLSKGLVLVTGPTGSGKSTTLAAMIDLINKSRSDHIITIEDPIEFVHYDQCCLVNQREVKKNTKSFASALRAALRQDPDIVLVGELRDLETIEMAMETAETGHLVFGTLHTNTAASTVDRIIDSFPADRQYQIRSMLSNSLKAAISQTLCKKIGGGRVAALEVLMIDHGIASMIRDGKIHQIPSAMQVGAGKGMKLLNQALGELVQSKQITSEEGYLRAVDKESYLKVLERLNCTPPVIGKKADGPADSTTSGDPETSFDEETFSKTRTSFNKVEPDSRKKKLAFFG